MDICKCACHVSPLFFHNGECCSNTGKVYLNDDFSVDLEKFRVLAIKESEKFCPCCGGTGKISKNGS
jgi:hypothetical protein